jgi:serine/threonine-protein kinase
MATNVEGYALGELLGAGGMGQVFATTVASRRPVVIKLLHEALLGDPFFVHRFAEEARAARTVRHPNVVRVVDDGATEAGTPYLVMERVEGTPLGIVIRRDGPLPLQRIRHIAIQILAGLGAIHRAHLVHGDLKSDNVLVDAHDKATIIDFGLARSANDGRGAIEDGMISGTPEYMAPEIINGEPLTVASEVYSVAIIIYEMLTGTTPFSGGTSAEICARHLTDDVVAPSLRAPDRAVPVALETTIMRALAKDPEARHSGAELLAAAIACAIPATCHEAPSHDASASFSTTTSTRQWTQRNEPPASHPAIAAIRQTILEAQASGDPDAVIVAHLALAKQLLQQHSTSDAASELESGLRWLRTHAEGSRETWRILLTLAAVRDRLGDRESAASCALEARDIAQSARNELGVARASKLLGRFDRFAKCRRRGSVRCVR